MSLLVHELVLGTGSGGGGSNLQLSSSTSMNVTLGTAAHSGVQSLGGQLSQSRVVSVSNGEARLNEDNGGHLAQALSGNAYTYGSNAVHLSTAINGQSNHAVFHHSNHVVGRSHIHSLNHVKKMVYNVPFVLQDHNYGAPPPPTPPPHSPPIHRTSSPRPQSYKVHHIIPPTISTPLSPQRMSHHIKSHIQHNRKILRDSAVISLNHQLGSATQVSSAPNGVIITPPHAISRGNVFPTTRPISQPTPTIQHTSNVSQANHQIPPLPQPLQPLPQSLPVAPIIKNVERANAPLSPPSKVVSQIMASMPLHRQQFMPHPKAPTFPPPQAPPTEPVNTPLSPHNGGADTDEESRLSDRSSSAGPSGEETETAPEGEGEDIQSDDSVTRCICDFTHDDGYMIQCDRCFVWQHVDCMEIDRSNIPEEYLCEACSPRPIDRTKARSLQTRRKQEIKAHLLRFSSSDSDDNAPMALKNRSNSKSLERKVLKKKKSRAKEVKVTRKTNAPIKKILPLLTNNMPNNIKISPPVDEKERKPITKIRRRQSSTCIPDSPVSDNSQAPMNIEQLRLWVEDYEIAVTNHYSPELRARIHSARINGISPEFRESTQGALLGHRCKVVPRINKQKCYNEKILVATTRLLVGTAIIEYQGKYVLKEQWSPMAVPPNLPYLPFVLQYNMVKEDLSICVDARTYGNDARFARRDEDYNAEITHVVERGSVHLYVVACKQIDEDDEIVLSMETAMRLAKFPLMKNIAPKPATIISNQKVPQSCSSPETKSEKVVTGISTKEVGSPPNAKCGISKIDILSSKKSLKRLPLNLPLALPFMRSSRRSASIDANITETPHRSNVDEVIAETPTSPIRQPRTSNGQIVQKSPIKIHDHKSPIRSPVRSPDPKSLKSPSKLSPKSTVKSPAKSPGKLVSPLKFEEDPYSGNESPSSVTPSKDTQKMTREEKKIAAYIKAFERMEKAALRRKETEKRKEEDRGRRQSESQGDECHEHYDTEVRPKKKGKRRAYSSPQKRTIDNSTESPFEMTDDTTGGSSSEGEKARGSESGFGSPPTAGNLNSFRFPKTKKSMMNEWLSETIEPVLQPNMSPGGEITTGVPQYYMRSPTTTCKKVTQPLAINSALLNNDIIYAGHSAKKRWLRQAIIDESDPHPGLLIASSCSPNSRPDSPCGTTCDYVTPLKKRRLARESMSSEQSNTPPTTPGHPGMDEEKMTEELEIDQVSIGSYTMKDEPIDVDDDEDFKPKIEPVDEKYNIKNEEVKVEDIKRELESDEKKDVKRETLDEDDSLGDDQMTIDLSQVGIGLPALKKCEVSNGSSTEDEDIPFRQTRSLSSESRSRKKLETKSKKIKKGSSAATPPIEKVKTDKITAKRPISKKVMSMVKCQSNSKKNSKFEKCIITPKNISPIKSKRVVKKLSPKGKTKDVMSGLKVDSSKQSVQSPKKRKMKSTRIIKDKDVTTRDGKATSSDSSRKKGHKSNNRSADKKHAKSTVSDSKCLSDISQCKDTNSVIEIAKDFDANSDKYSKQLINSKDSNCSPSQPEFCDNTKVSKPKSTNNLDPSNLQSINTHIEVSQSKSNNSLNKISKPDYVDSADKDSSKAIESVVKSSMPDSITFDEGISCTRSLALLEVSSKIADSIEEVSNLNNSIDDFSVSKCMDAVIEKESLSNCQNDLINSEKVYQSKSTDSVDNNFMDSVKLSNQSENTDADRKSLPHISNNNEIVPLSIDNSFEMTDSNFIGDVQFSSSDSINNNNTQIKDNCISFLDKIDKKIVQENSLDNIDDKQGECCVPEVSTLLLKVDESPALTQPITTSKVPFSSIVPLNPRSLPPLPPLPPFPNFSMHSPSHHESESPSRINDSQQPSMSPITPEGLNRMFSNTSKTPDVPLVEFLNGPRTPEGTPPITPLKNNSFRESEISPKCPLFNMVDRLVEEAASSARIDSSKQPSLSVTIPDELDSSIVSKPVGNTGIQTQETNLKCEQEDPESSDILADNIDIKPASVKRKLSILEYRKRKSISSEHDFRDDESCGKLSPRQLIADRTARIFDPNFVSKSLASERSSTPPYSPSSPRDTFNIDSSASGKWNDAPTLLEKQREDLRERLRRQFGICVNKDKNMQDSVKNDKMNVIGSKITSILSAKDSLGENLFSNKSSLTGGKNASEFKLGLQSIGVANHIGIGELEGRLPNGINHKAKSPSAFVTADKLLKQCDLLTSNYAALIEKQAQAQALANSKLEKFSIGNEIGVLPDKSNSKDSLKVDDSDVRPLPKIGGAKL